MVYHKWPFTSFAFSVTSNWALHVLYMEKKRGTSRGLTKQIFKYQMTFWLTRECYYLIHRVHRLMYRKKMFYNFALKNKTTDAISYWLVFIQHMNQTTWVLALISLYEFSVPWFNQKNYIGKKNHRITDMKMNEHHIHYNSFNVNIHFVTTSFLWKSGHPEAEQFAALLRRLDTQNKAKSVSSCFSESQNQSSNILCSGVSSSVSVSGGCWLDFSLQDCWETGHDSLFCYLLPLTGW